jgi:hypothetical protein
MGPANLHGSINSSALLAIYPSECYASTNFLELDSFAEFTSTETFTRHHPTYVVRLPALGRRA